MDMCRRAEFRRGEGMVIVESEYGGWVVIRAGIRSLVECGSGSRMPRLRREGTEDAFAKKPHSPTIRAAPLQIPFSIVSYLSNGPTITCK